MTNKTLIAALMCMTAASGLCQSKISVDGLTYLDNYREQQTALKTLHGTGPSETVIAVIATLCNGYTSADVEAEGFTVTTDLGESVIVTMNVEDVERFAGLDCVQSLTFGGKKSLKVDGGRAATGVDAAHKGITVNGTTRSFTGNGVIVGMFDSGLEPNHINFLDDAGNPRLERLWVYTGENGYGKEYKPVSIKGFETDDKTETHGSHVAGILTGSYKGKGTYAYSAPSTTGYASTRRTNQDIPYYGVAYGATPVFGIGTLYDPNILDGVERIVNYAKTQGKPCVVNLSLGSNVGPHDGTDDFTNALNALGRDAIIVVSSGNEGDMDMSLTKTFTNSDTSVSTFLIPYASYATTIDSPIDIWASDNSPLTVSLLAYNTNTKTTTTIATTSKAGTTTFSTKTGLSAGSGIIYASVNAANNRYNVYIYPKTGILPSYNYNLMIKVEGKAGQKINMYYGGYGNFSSKNVAGVTSGSPSESINSMATADNIISVGSFVTRMAFGILSDNSLYTTWGEKTGQISTFSSYGTMPDGTKLPQVLAPGSTIISSFNRYYVEGTGATYDEGKDSMTGKAANGMKTDYWGVMDGTSMASPFAAGVIALWLEADPTLDIDGIKDVLANSCTTDSYTGSNPAAAGYGKINAEKGLKYILTNPASIGSVTDDAGSRLLITLTDSGFDIVMGGEARFTATMYDLQGRAVTTAEGSDARATLDTVGLTPGIYVIAVQSPNLSVTRKVTVR